MSLVVFCDVKIAPAHYEFSCQLDLLLRNVVAGFGLEGGKNVGSSEGRGEGGRGKEDGGGEQVTPNWGASGRANAWRVSGRRFAVAWHSYWSRSIYTVTQVCHWSDAKHGIGPVQLHQSLSTTGRCGFSQE